MSGTRTERVRERLDFFPLNARRGKEWLVCDYCRNATTKGRDFLGDPICEACFRTHYLEAIKR